MTMFSNDVLIKQKNNFNFQNSRKSNTLFLFNNRYDEPTYLTFRIDFFPTTLPVNKIDSLPGYYENDIKLVSYDDMPQPLLDINNDYSTYKYLKEQIGDEYRADLLKAFISGLADLTLKSPSKYSNCVSKLSYKSSSVYLIPLSRKRPFFNFLSDIIFL